MKWDFVRGNMTKFYYAIPKKAQTNEEASQVLDGKNKY